MLPQTREPRRRRRLLLVEDEILVGIFMREILEDLGFEVGDACRTLSDGLVMARNGKFDGAVLDMNLNGEAVYPLADLLVSQDVPFVFVTGYSADAVAERFVRVPTVQKPVAADALGQILERHLVRPEKRGDAQNSNEQSFAAQYAEAR